MMTVKGKRIKKRVFQREVLDMFGEAGHEIIRIHGGPITSTPSDYRLPDEFDHVSQLKEFLIGEKWFEECNE